MPENITKPAGEREATITEVTAFGAAAAAAVTITIASSSVVLSLIITSHMHGNNKQELTHESFSAGARPTMLCTATATS